MEMEYKILAIQLFTIFVFSESKIVVLLDDPTLSPSFEQGMNDFSETNEKSLDFVRIEYKNDTEDWEEICQQSSGISIVLDLSYRQDTDGRAREFYMLKRIPYFRVEIPTDSLIKASNAMLEEKEATNGFLIFHGESIVNRGIHLILGNTLIRFAFLNAITQNELIVEKFDYRVPSAVVLYGTRDQFSKFIETKPAIVRNRTEWVFMFDAFSADLNEPLNVKFPHIRGYYDPNLCCRVQNPNRETGYLPDPENCNRDTCRGEPREYFLSRLAYIVQEALYSLTQNGNTVRTFNVDCRDNSSSPSDTGTSDYLKQIGDAILSSSSNLLHLVEENKFVMRSPIKFDDSFNGTIKEIGEYEVDKGRFRKVPTYNFRPRPNYFRIGVVENIPWTWKEINNVTNEVVWKGYCIDLAEGIANQLNFTFDLVESVGFGSRDTKTGRWNGLTGDLVHGKIEIAVAPYIMTSEREEFIDFVSPYYEQSGLLIAMKKPVVQNSLFKFMTVLRPEVWLSIAAATFSTGVMLWFLDKFSPYSAQNNPHKYKTFRKFTLKESFWFALTSFTPQGGGEPPKAFSGRTLVAAYWIFVVLMLATFTANLAAFLTVERMQSPIRNLEHLSAQSSVKYSVQNGSTAERFFRNMANAEEILYQMWRNLTLTAPSSAKEYIVWEYPIREMYIHIYNVIKSTGMLETKEEGFYKAATDEYYAFIHDAAQTRYEVYHNCNLTIIGEAFAEAPYALAVAQGNPLQDNISMAILQLQTARYFEQLSTKYWSTSCPSLEGESDGISLESLGGVFIATIIGLGIAFISLAIEVFTTARKRKLAKLEANKLIKPALIGPLDFYKAAPPGTNKKDLALFKRSQFLPEVIN